MNRPRSIAATTSQILFANLAKNAALFIVLIVVSRVFGPTDLGIFSLALAITTPFFAFALFGARVLRLTGPQELDTGSIAWLLAMTGFAALVLSLALTLGMQVFTSDGSPLLVGGVIWISLYKWTDIYTELYAGQLQRTKRTLTLLMTSGGGAALIVVSSWAAAAVWQNLLAVCVAVATSGAVFALTIARVAREHDAATLWGIKRAFRMGFPLGLGGGIAVFSSSVPQYVVAATIDTAAAGILAVTLYLYALADLFGAAYGQAWVHRIDAIETTANQFKFSLRVGLISAAVLFPIAALGVWLYAILAPLVFGPGVIITLSSGIALTISVALLPLAHLLLIALFVRIAYMQSLLIMLASAIVVTAAAVVLVPWIGIAGALWAVAFGVLARIGASLLFMKRILRLEEV